MKVLIRLAVLMIFFCALAFIACDDGGDSSSSKTYAIGDTGPSGVGTVFYISDGGKHGLEAAPSLWDEDPNMDNEDPSRTWSNVTGTAIGVTAQGTAIGTGMDNTLAIIGQDSHSSSAALLCRNYEGGGETDWFLPTSAEITELATQEALGVVSGFADDYYWTSHENSATQAEVYDFNSGSAGPNNKSNSARVRPIREF